MFPILTKFVGGHDREVMLLCNQKFVKEWEKGFWCSQITCLLQTESSIKIENALRLSLTVIKDLQILKYDAQTKNWNCIFKSWMYVRILVSDVIKEQSGLSLKWCIRK